METTAKMANAPGEREVWETIEPFLTSAALSIEVREINGSAADVLDYEKSRDTGLNVIAIGGDKLSRGLTLEGLTVSYFTRPSRMYDTLMQMGRWFGYPPGYLDLCRLYAPRELISWFEHIADAAEELRREFELMYKRGETPATYGQRVRSHPALLVTSQVKMRNSVELLVSYGGAISETVSFDREGETVDANYAATEALLRKVAGECKLRRTPLRSSIDRTVSGKYMWSGVKADEIVGFLDGYKTAPDVRRVNTNLLGEYIQKQVEAGHLVSWSVLLAGKEPVEDEPDQFGYQFGLIARSDHPRITNGVAPDCYRIRRLVSPSDESWDLEASQYEEALVLTRQSQGKSTAKLPGGPELRSVRAPENGLLIVYPLKHQQFSGPNATTRPFVGFAISFPGIKHDVPVRYRVNDLYMSQLDEYTN